MEIHEDDGFIFPSEKTDSLMPLIDSPPHKDDDSDFLPFSYALGFIDFLNNSLMQDEFEEDLLQCGN